MKYIIMAAAARKGKLLSSFLFLILSVREFVISVDVGTSVRCPSEICNCTDSAVLSGPHEFYLICHRQNNSVRFKYVPNEATLYALDKLDSVILRQFVGLKNFYADNLNLTAIPPDFMDTHSQFKIIYIKGNYLPHIPPAIFKNKPQLFALVLERNSLVELPLGELPEPSKLKRLFLNGNRLVLNGNTFQNFSSLEWLFLASNNLSQLPKNLLANLLKLTQLDLSQNSISEIPDLFFANCNFLQNLLLNNNKLVTLTDNFSSGLSRLNQLYLSHNYLESISDRSFSSLWNVQNFTLNFNSIRKMGKLSLLSMNDLKWLHLNHNRMELMDLPILPSALIMLNLSYNSVTKLDFGESGRNLQRLVDLDLRNNNIAFADLNGVNSEVLASHKENMLVTIYNRQLGRKFRHSQINLENNLISDVNTQGFGFQKTTDPTFIFLNGNPINCDPIINETEVVNNFLLIFNNSPCLMTSVRNLTNNYCPTQCSCFLNQSLIDCNKANLSSVPEGIFDNFNRLNLNFNPISHLSRNSFWKSLAILNLNFCSLTSSLILIPALVIDGKIESVFQNLSNLHTLTLSHNNLSLDPSTMFLIGLTNLEILDLSNNKIQLLTTTFFKDVKRLRVLDLSRNQIKSTQFLLALISLERIDLKGNDISEIDDGPHYLTNLTELDLSENKIKVDINAIKFPPNVKLILLNDNEIRNFENNSFPIFPMNVRRINLKSNRLVFIDINDFKIPNGTVIELTNNLINYVDFDESLIDKSNYQILLQGNPLMCDCKQKSFVEYFIDKKLNKKSRNPSNSSFHLGVQFPEDDLKCISAPADNPYISFRSIQLESLCQVFCPDSCRCIPPFAAEIKDLDCTHQFPNRILFEKLERLTVKLIDYKSLESIKWWMNLSVIVISQINGSTNDLKNFDLGDKPVLEEFAFEMSELRYVSAQLLKNAPNLKIVRLSRNKIELLPPDLIFTNLKLESVNLSGNLLSEIPNPFFSRSIELENIDLSDNSLTRISADHFRNNANLKELRLNANGIISFAYRSFQHLSSLSFLDLSGNYIDEEIFGLLPYGLKRLNLSDNKINHFDSKSMHNVESIDLSFNFIQIINLGIFVDYYSELRIISLESNNISEVQFDRLESSNSTLNKKISIKLAGNPIDCNCKANWILQCIRIPLIVQCPFELDYPGLKCQYPILLKNRFVYKLRSDEMFCNLSSCSSGCNCHQMAENSAIVVNCSFSDRLVLPTTNPSNVSVLILNGNPNISLTDLQSTYWQNLSRLSVNQCGYLAHELTENLLSRNNKLEMLEMADDNISFIPRGFFDSVQNLIKLDLSGNKLTSLTQTMFVNGLVGLKVLNLRRNKINSIENETFARMTNLERIDFSSNNISFLPQFLFNNQSHLNHLNLSSNRIKTIPIRLFNHLNIFEQKPADEISSADFIGGFHRRASSTNVLDLSYNRLTGGADLNTILIGIWSIVVIVILDHNSISEMTLPSSAAEFNRSNRRSLKVHISENPISCDCSIAQFQNVQNSSWDISLLVNENEKECDYYYYSHQFSGLRNKKVCKEKKKCDNRNCKCIKNIVDENISMVCINSNLQFLPETAPPNVTELLLDNNNISTLRGLDHISWSNLNTLSVRNNQISKLLNETLPRNLRFVALDGNKMSEPSGWLLELMKNKSFSLSFRLSRNPWKCYCSNEYFKSWLLNDHQLSVTDLFNMTCDGQDNNALLFVNANLCPLKTNWKTFGPLLISMLALLVLVIVVMVFYCRHKQAIYVYLYGKGLFRFCVTENEIDAGKDYDAFVSYANEDTEFVEHHLVPQLENNEPHYKLCVHERDWMLGEQILDQIELSVEKSRRVIIILSSYFINSMWGSIEFKTAHYHSIKDRINRIIVIVMDELPPKEEMDADLRMHINLNTYLRRGDPKFWQKLRFAMSKVRFANKMPKGSKKFVNKN